MDVPSAGRRPRLRLEDVAAEVGLSTASVSLVLRGAAGPSAATRERVLEAAARVGVAGRRLLLANLVDHFGAEVVGPAMANDA